MSKKIISTEIEELSGDADLVDIETIQNTEYRGFIFPS